MLAGDGVTIGVYAVLVKGGRGWEVNKEGGAHWAGFMGLSQPSWRAAPSAVLHPMKGAWALCTESALGASASSDVTES